MVGESPGGTQWITAASSASARVEDEDEAHLVLAEHVGAQEDQVVARAEASSSRSARSARANWSASGRSKSPDIAGVAQPALSVRTALVAAPPLSRRSAELAPPLSSMPERPSSRCVSVVPPSFRELS